ncbi:MAG TPA: AMP-binding protein [Acidimicrobiia bacterium]|nr:AMP-binding protein [Acidimicrobiia bacterium]
MDPASSSGPSRMRNPSDWIDRWADEAPEQIALWLGDGSVTYGQLRDLIHSRARSASSEFDDGEVVPTLVRLDLASIVEVFAISSLGAVPLPSTTTPFPRPGAAHAPGAVVAVATSGSSGAKRVVPLTMANLASAVAASRLRLGTGADDGWLLTLPIDHIAGLSVLFRTFESGGAAIVSAFGSDTAGIIERTRPSVASLVPTMVYRLLETDPASLAGIGTVLVGGGPLRSSIADRAAMVGVDLVATYGSTETSSQVATMARGERMRGPGYVGLPLDGFTVGIEPGAADDERTGTILIDGPAVFGGYLGEPAREGPHRSGDIGFLDDDGALTVLGRVDDLIVSGGENVSLVGVADALSAFSGVSEVATVALDDEEWGSIIGAVVVTDRSIASLRDEARDRLDTSMVPRRWIVADHIPQLENGKHDRAAIDAMFTR